MNRSDVRNARRVGISELAIAQACAVECSDSCDIDTWFEADPDWPGRWRTGVGHERSCPQHLLNVLGVG